MFRHHIVSSNFIKKYKSLDRTLKSMQSQSKRPIVRENQRDVDLTKEDKDHGETIPKTKPTESYGRLTRNVVLGGGSAEGGRAAAADGRRRSVRFEGRGRSEARRRSRDGPIHLHRPPLVNAVSVT